MSNSVFLKPDENGNWGSVNVIGGGGGGPVISSLQTFQDAATGTGNGTAADVGGYTTVAIRVVITGGTANVALEASVNGTDYSSIYGQSTTGNILNSVGSTADVRVNVAGYKYFRTRISSISGATVTVSGYLTTADFDNIVGYMDAFGNSDSNLADRLVLGTSAYNLLYNGSSWARQRTANQYTDGNTGSTMPGFAIFANNGTSFDRVRTAADGMGTGTLATQPVLWGGSSYNRQYSAGAIGDAHGGASIATQAGYGYAGSTGFDRMRVGKIYKYIEFLNLADNTATTVWTPAAGRKFRLMAVQISASAASILHLRDGAGGTIFHTQRTAGIDSKAFDFGNGYISSTANNVLEILNKSAATINVWVTAWGTEE